MKTQFDQNNAAGKEQIWLHEVFAVRTGHFFVFICSNGNRNKRKSGVGKGRKSLQQKVRKDL